MIKEEIISKIFDIYVKSEDELKSFEKLTLAAYNSLTYQEIFKRVFADKGMYSHKFNSYQGDYVFIGKQYKEGFTFLIIGYGSCSLCDSLEACDNVADLLELVLEMHNNLRHFDSKQALMDFINNPPELQWYESELKYLKEDERFLEFMKKYI